MAIVHRISAPFVFRKPAARVHAPRPVSVDPGRRSSTMSCAPWEGLYFEPETAEAQDADVSLQLDRFLDELLAGK
ncbi:hypothetical protein [Arthrobacter sp. NyZ413]|uniref:hypothetical protein n=1 Tax=Arthrobacter sp. NyZ413 TaxID=3144669 RepID=UPI003BF832AC